MKRIEKPCVNFFDYSCMKEVFTIVFFFCTLPICIFGTILCIIFSTLPMLIDIFLLFGLLSLILFIFCYLIIFFVNKKYERK